MINQGSSGLGKTTFINTLFATLLKEHYVAAPRQSTKIERTVSIDVVRAGTKILIEIEEKGFNVKLTIIDTPGFGDYLNNQDCWVPVVEFLDDRYEQQIKTETQQKRNGADDMRVHACLYFIQPNGHTLTSLDIKAMKELGERVNLIPVIAKGDTMTKAAVKLFKDRILDEIAANEIKIYTPPIEGDDDDEAPGIIQAMPFSIISSLDEVMVKGEKVRGRVYPWGVAQVENDNHCDFKKLRNLLIRFFMHDLITSTNEKHYEEYRAKKLVQAGVTDEFIGVPNLKKEEEELRKRFTEQVKLEEQRFRKWEQNLISERDRLNKDLESFHEEVKELEAEIESLSQ